MVEDRILKSAQLEFAKRGFYKTVVSDIADRAGVGKGTVYRHFGNKEDLFLTLIKQGTQDLQKQIQNVIEKFSSPVSAIENILDIHFEFYEHSREFIEIIIIEGLQVTGSIRDEFVNEIHKIRSLFKQLFAQGIEQGLFRSNDPDKLAVLFQGFIWSVLRSGIIYGVKDPRKQFKKLMFEVFLNGIKVS